MKTFLLSSQLQSAKEEELVPGDRTLKILSIEELRTMRKTLPHQKALMKALGQWDYCRVTLFGQCMIGVISLPVFAERLDHFIKIGFYLTKDSLYLAGDNAFLFNQVGRMRETQFAQTPTTAALFCAFLNNWLDNIISPVQGIEKNLITIEDSLSSAASNSKLPYRRLVLARKDLLKLHSFIYEFSNLAAAVRANANQMLNAQECELYGFLADRAERIRHHLSTLREYVLQIREMSQLQLQYRQANAMRILAVVSLIFQPLTLLVGWYGMNFENMPELSWHWGYFGFCLLAGILVAAELAYFHHKGLL